MLYWQLNAYILALLISSILSITASIYVWQRRLVVGAAPLALLMMAAAEWSLTYALELANPYLEAKIFWARMQYFGIVGVVVLLFVVVVQYTGRERWLTRLNIAALASVPLISLALVWTNDFHGLIWNDISLAADAAFPVLELGHGPFFWVLIIYSYLVLVFVILLLFPLTLGAARPYRAQSSVMLAGMFAPWAGNVIYIFDLSPFPYLDLTPFAFTFSGLAAVWGLFRFRLLDIVPAARDMVVDSIEYGVIVLDDKGRIVDANVAAQQWLGRTSENIIGQSTRQVFASRPDLFARFRHVAKTQTELVIESEGAPRYYDLTISPLRDRRGKLSGRVLLIHDITQRKNTEQALRESEERSRRLVELSPEAIVVLNDCTFVYTNSSGLRLFGAASLDELIGKSLLDRVDPTCRKLVSISIEQSMQQHIAAPLIEYTLLRLDGQPFEAEVTATMTTYQGKSAIQAIIRDITERKRADQQLRDYQARLEEQNDELRKLSQAIEQSANSVVITDTNGYIEYVNPRFIAVTGYTAAESLGRNPRFLKSGEHDAAIYRDLWQTIKAGQIWQGEFHNRRKDGTLYWEMSTIAPVYDNAGRIMNFIAIKEDITERKEAEATLRHYTSELEKRNAELDAFAHTVAHDLKNPLTGLLGYIRLMEMQLSETSQDQQREYLQMLSRSGQRIKNIINELLLLSSVREMESIETYALDMADIVDEVVERLEFLIDRYQAEIIRPDSWPIALGYGPWIEEVWTNYLSNALKYGGSPPRIELGGDITESGAVCYWVRDNGEGLSPEEQARLFTPFERMHKVRAEGHGLGLSIVRRIMEKLGGQVGVESGKGQGSTFFFILPSIHGVEEPRSFAAVVGQPDV